MTDTRTRPRGARASLAQKPYPALLFDNFAVCARCMPGPNVNAAGVKTRSYNFEGVSERDGYVVYDHANACFRCEAGHVFTEDDGPRLILWEVEER